MLRRYALALSCHAADASMPPPDAAMPCLFTPLMPPPLAMPLLRHAAIAAAPPLLYDACFFAADFISMLYTPCLLEMAAITRCRHAITRLRCFTTMPYAAMPLRSIATSFSPAFARCLRYSLILP